MKKILRIKGGWFWKSFALVILGIVIACCGTTINGNAINGNSGVSTQPTTATINQVITYTDTVRYCNPYPTDGTQSDYLIVGVLLPTGWQGSKNLSITYNCASAGKGKMVPVTQPETTTKQAWSAALLTKFGIANNYINDMEWVVFQSDQAYSLGKLGSPVLLTYSLKVAADGNNARVNINYFVGEDHDGLHVTDGNLQSPCLPPYEYWATASAKTLTVSGGAGDVIDYADPQLSTVNPGKAQIDDYLTITFFDNVTATPAFNGSGPIYLRATAYNDHTAYKVAVDGAHTAMAQTANGSKTYQIAIWPRQFFNLTGLTKVDSMVYSVAADTTAGSPDVKNTTGAPFKFKFGCSSGTSSN